MLILSNVKPVTDTVSDLTRFTNKELVDQYNLLAPVVNKETVKRFSDRNTGAKRLHNLFIEVSKAAPEALKPQSGNDWSAEAAIVAKNNEDEIVGDVFDLVKKIQDENKAEAKPVKAKADKRKSRQKVFNYPPQAELKALVEGSLRARARDLLLNGATFAEVEELVRQFDREKGKPSDHRIAERTYGLIRLLHTYVGYALREEGQGEDKKIFVMTPEAWEQRKSNS